MSPTVTYTGIALVAAVAAVVLDRAAARTRLTTSGAWWTTYAIVVVFQLLTNGWLTGRRIVTYDSAAIIGGDHVQLIGDGRLCYAPVEDLVFGFALVLTTCVVWTWLGRRDGEEHA